MTAVQAEFQKFQDDLIEKGIEKGIGRGQARALLRILEARGVSVGEAIRERILSCEDPAVLDRWLDRALIASAAEEVVKDS